MAKSDPSSSKKEKLKNIKWVITIFLVTIVVSGTFSMGSDALMSVSGIAMAFVILLFIIMLGILFDIIGVAVTSADENPSIPWQPGKSPEPRKPSACFARPIGWVLCATM